MISTYCLTLVGPRRTPPHPPSTFSISDILLSSTWFIGLARERACSFALVYSCVCAFFHSLSPNTLCSYFAQISQFFTWHSKLYGEWPTFPVSPQRLALFFTARVQNFSAVSSLNVCWAALKWGHEIFGDASVFSSRFLHLIFRGLQRSVSNPITRKKPVSKDILLKIVKLYAHVDASLVDLRLSLFFVLGYAGFLRFSELANIQLGHIFVSPDFRYFRIHLPHSKTDQFRLGRNVLIVANATEFCPLQILCRYLREAGITDSNSYLFQTFRRKKGMGYFLSGARLNYGAALSLVKRALASVGEDPKLFGTHSLRSGGASSAAASDVSERLLQGHGRWKSSTSKDMYIDESLDRLLSVSRKIL